MNFPQSLNLKNKPLLIGMTLYVVSFFLVAVQQGRGGGSALGFMCAHVLLLYPWETAKTALHSESSFVHYLSGTVSGLINPVFWLFLNKPVGAIRTALFLMMPACWFVFYEEKLYPREGYFLWTAGMLLILLTTRLPAKPSNQVSLTLELHR
jgi:hypothetical protein